MVLCGKKQKNFGCDYISTGHYAKAEFSKKYDTWVIRKSHAGKKDQTYVLWNISKDLIPHLILPLADMGNKEEIRKIAKENNLKVANKPDSEDICFIPDGDYKKFLKTNSNIKEKTGNIILTSGEIIGKHNGLISYTIGQRKGLGISYKEPLYVISLNEEKNELVVGTENELYSSNLYANEVNFLIEYDKWQDEIYAKIRYSSEMSKVKVKKQGDTIEVIFEKPQRAITKGQSVVFYDKEGILLRRRKNNLVKII